MSIEVLYRGKVILIKEKEIKAGDLLRKMGLSPASSLVIKNGEVVTEKEVLKEGDNIRVINAISGGLQRA
jgi:sulfur carrier protein